MFRCTQSSSGPFRMQRRKRRFSHCSPPRYCQGSRLVNERIDQLVVIYMYEIDLFVIAPVQRIFVIQIHIPSVDRSLYHSWPGHHVHRIMNTASHLEESSASCTSSSPLSSSERLSPSSSPPSPSSCSRFLLLLLLLLVIPDYLVPDFLVLDYLVPAHLVPDFEVEAPRNRPSGQPLSPKT